MYNKFMTEKQLSVKVGDTVMVLGNKGTVTEVIKSIDTEWNGSEYVKIPKTESTSVRVKFFSWEDLANWGQYQNGVYGEYSVVNKMETVKTYEMWIKIKSLGNYEYGSPDNEVWEFNGDLYRLCFAELPSKERKEVIDSERLD